MFCSGKLEKQIRESSTRGKEQEKLAAENERKLKELEKKTKIEKRKLRIEYEEKEVIPDFRGRRFHFVHM